MIAWTIKAAKKSKFINEVFTTSIKNFKYFKKI